MLRLLSFRAVTLALSTLTVAAHAQVIVNLAPLNDPNGIIDVRGVSADGLVVCGQSSISNRAARWDGIVGLQLLGGSLGSIANALSSNGAIAAGTSDLSGFKGVRFLPGGVVQSLGLLPNYDTGQAYALSSNGSVAVGNLHWTVGPIQAFRWDNGSLALLPIPNNFQSDAYCVSGDGSAVFGVVSLPGQDAVRWRVGFPIEVLGNLTNPAGASYPVACNANGTVAVGTHYVSPSGQRGFRWTPGNGFEELGLPFFATDSSANDLTADALAIVGNINIAQRAAFWTETGLWIDLNDYLPTVGVNLTGWVLGRCVGVSDDGTVLVGFGYFNGNPAGWLVRNIPPICGPRIDLQPSNTITCANNNTSLVAIATPPQVPTIMTHQWYKRVVSGIGFVNIPMTNGPTGTGSTRVGASGTTSGFSTCTMAINNVTMADAGDYYCVITNGCGSNTTILVNLLVRPNVNNDNIIDGADLSVLLANFGNNVTPWTSGDFNGDGIVNSADLSTLLANFGQQC